MRVMMAAIVAPEGHKHGAPDIERRHAGGDGADPVIPGRNVIGRDQNGILDEESGGTGNACDSKSGAYQGPKRNGDLASETAHLPHVLLTTASVDHATRAEEEQRFEKRVRQDVPDSGRKSADTFTQEHVAELGDGG